jgi:hypothetical protein
MARAGLAGFAGGGQGRRRMRLACGHRSSDAAHDNTFRQTMEEVKGISVDAISFIA